MSLMYVEQPKVGVIVERGKPMNFVTGDEFLRNFGLNASASEESQALRQCPAMVRLAIASHFTWWFIARAHSAVVRTFAHAFMAACKANVLPLGEAYRPDSNDGFASLGVLVNRRYGVNSHSYPVMAYRVLHFFGRYLQEGGAVGPNANAMQKKDWAHYLRPGVRAYSEHRSSEHDAAYGCVGKADNSDYQTMEFEGTLVRSSASRWLNFREGAVAAMQPFFTVEMRPSGFDEDRLGVCNVIRAAEVPKLWIQKPRSKRLVAMIPRTLAYGIEQVGEELPLAVRYAQERSPWEAAIRREVQRYIDQREHAALVAMSHRDSIVSWLRQYDALAAMHYAMPQVEGRNVCMNSQAVEFNAAKDVHLQFPGICENNLHQL